MMLHPSENNKEGLVVGGAGGGTGGGGPGHCCSYSIPNLAPTVSFVFVTRLVFSVIVVPSHAPGLKRFVLSEPFR